MPKASGIKPDRLPSDRGTFLKAVFAFWPENTALWHTHLCCLSLIIHSWVSAGLPPQPSPASPVLSIVTAPGQTQGGLLLSQVCIKRSHPLLRGSGEEPTNWAGPIRDCLPEKGVRTSQSGGQWLAGAGHEVEIALKDPFSEMSFQPNKNLSLSSKS